MRKQDDSLLDMIKICRMATIEQGEMQYEKTYDVRMWCAISENRKFNKAI